MTEVAFHFNVGESQDDRLVYACRLLRKAINAGAQIQVVANMPVLVQLDRLLWTFSPLEFLSHCTVGQSGVTDHMIKLSPAILSEGVAQHVHRDVMVNLQSDIPMGFEAFRRVIEIVSLDGTDRHQARLRWKRYSDLGFTITRHDIALQGA